ncbi:MAG: vitamin K epoxide reductase family protein [Chloroflexota bacterium]|nr:vitamin K epoxide reductase family protein [Chloroflexota bacterium]MBI5703482.1 vitamin K epoxide reductase family protein [Chloroflexota bacterium]
MEKRLSQITVALAILGLLVSIYMTVYKITSNNKMCLGSGDCSTVNASRYSEINGIPVALIGVIGYAAIIGVHWLERRNAFLEENSSLILFGFSLIGFLFTLWLVYVEIALLKALCPFCVTSQITMTIIFILSVIRVVRQP